MIDSDKFNNFLRELLWSQEGRADSIKAEREMYSKEFDIPPDKRTWKNPEELVAFARSKEVEAENALKRVKKTIGPFIKQSSSNRNNFNELILTVSTKDKEDIHKIKRIIEKYNGEILAHNKEYFKIKFSIILYGVVKEEFLKEGL